MALAAASGVYEFLVPCGHGSWPHVLAFNAAFALSIGLITPRPRSHVYATLAVLLALGFWVKFAIRQVVDYPFLEPIGDFTGSIAQWDSALDVVTVGIVGVVCGRALHVWLGRRGVRQPAGAQVPSAPALYMRHVHLFWLGTAACAVAAYAWNAHAAVYITGVNPRITLPAGGNAALAWFYVLGLPMWIAVLIDWERRRRHDATIGWRLLWIPLVEAIVNSGSLLSRASFLLRLAPYWIAQSRETVRIRASHAVSAVVLGLGFCLSLTIVMALRSVVYSNMSSPTSETSPMSTSAPAQPGAVTAGDGASSVPPRPRRSAAASVREVGTLVVDRWIGLEGVLAIVATPRSFNRLGAALREDPAVGVDGMYQQIAHAPYPKEPRFTFLTLAGSVAVLSLAGSLTVVFAGMCGIALLFMGIEALARAMTHNEILCAVASVSAAFAISQVTFPRLLAAFTVELLGTTLVLGVFSIAIERSGRRPERPSWKPGGL